MTNQIFLFIPGSKLNLDLSVAVNIIYQTEQNLFLNKFYSQNSIWVQ